MEGGEGVTDMLKLHYRFHFYEYTALGIVKTFYFGGLAVGLNIK